MGDMQRNGSDALVGLFQVTGDGNKVRIERAWCRQLVVGIPCRPHFERLRSLPSTLHQDFTYTRPIMSTGFSLLVVHNPSKSLDPWAWVSPFKPEVRLCV